MSSVYKILSKVLATRIKRFISKVVGPCWSAFVDRRQILVAAMFANELVDSNLMQRRKLFFAILIPEKAFDFAPWDCLLYVSTKMGFGERWCNQMKRHVSACTFFVLINGCSFGFFQSSLGLRQVDLYSPCLS